MVTGAGTQTAALAFGGQSPGSPAVDSTEEFGGTSWTSGGALNTAKNSSAGAGTQTAAFKVHTTTHEQYNGSSWTETTEINNSRSVFAGAGTTTASLVFGGENPSTQLANTESWNGTAWTEVADLSSAQYFNSGAGSNTSALSFALDTPSPTATEEWSFPSAPVVQLGQVWFNTASSTLKGHAQQGTGTWSSGGDMNNGREQGGYFGSQNSGVAAGGGVNAYVEEYDGSSWTEVTNIPANGAAAGGTGPQTAGIIYGWGHAPTGGNTNNTTSYNGTSWTEVGDLNSGRNVGGSSGGSQTSAMYIGGSPASALTEVWDGSSWTEVGDLNDSRYYAKGGGTTTATIVAGGTGGSPPTNPTQSESWDGTSWTETNELNTGRGYLTGGGDNYNSIIVFGGGPQPGGVYDLTETWNGSSWSEEADMATASETSFGTTQGAGLATYRARTPSPQNTTEEWTISSTTKTLTVSQTCYFLLKIVLILHEQIRKKKYTNSSRNRI